MTVFKEQLVTDHARKPVGVFLDINEYRRLLDELEELDSIRAYDAAKSGNEQPIPFAQAIQEIETSRP